MRIAAVTRWEYDPAKGYVLRKVDAKGQAISYTYTPEGYLSKRTWARGVSATYSYDSIGRVSDIDYSDTTPDVAFSYTRAGQVTSVSSGTVPRYTHTYTYSPIGQLLKEAISTRVDRTITRS